MKYITQYSADMFYQMYKKGTLKKNLQKATYLHGEQGLIDDENAIMFDPTILQKVIHHEYDSPEEEEEDTYYSTELFYMHPSKFDRRPKKDLTFILLYGGDVLSSYNELLPNVFWEPSNPILKSLFYGLKICTWIWNFITSIICFVLKIAVTIITIPFGSLTLVLGGLTKAIYQLKYDRNFHYANCLANSYIKALLIIFSIATAPLWIPALWGALHWGDGSNPALVIGGAALGVMAFCFFTGGGVVTLAGISGLIIGHGYVEYNMSKHNHIMTDSDLSALDNGLTSAFIGMGIANFFNKVSH